MRRSILVIGAGWEQVPLLRKAKETGLEVMATHVKAEAEGFALARRSAVVDPRDLPAVLDLARRNHVEAVTADQCDYSIYAAAYVARCLGLPGPDLSAVQRATNKKLTRLACMQDRSIFQPEFVSCTTFEEARRAVEEIGLPIVFKPVDNRGAFGVTRVDDVREVEAAYLVALANSHSREVLVERWIDGRHVTVDGFAFARGAHRVLAMATKRIISGPRPIIDEVLYPGELDDADRDGLAEATLRIVRSLGIDRGATHSEFIVDAMGRPYLLEIANRGGGVHTASIIVPAVSGVDVCDLLVRQAVGEDPAPVEHVEARGAALSFIIFAPGRLERIEGLEACLALPGVLHLQLLVQPGDTLRPPESGAGRHGFLITSGAGLVEARSVAEEVRRRLRPVYAP